MTIRFSCPCGQPIAAGDEFAGRRVQCVACKQSLTVPGVRRSRPTQLASASAAQTLVPAPLAEPPVSTAPPVAPPGDPPVSAPILTLPEREPPRAAPTILGSSTEAALPMTVSPEGLRFNCVCGAPYQASPDHAGEPALCPCCSAVLFIPSPADVRRNGDRPVVAAQNCSDQFSPDPPGMSARRRLGLVLLVLLLIGASGYTAWAIHFKGATERSRNRGIGALSLVSADAAAFVAVRPADLAESKLRNDLRDISVLGPPGWLGQTDALRKLTLGKVAEFGLLDSEIEQIVDVRRPPQGFTRGMRAFLACETKEPVEQTRILKHLQGVKETRYRDKPYFTTPPIAGQQIAVHFVHDRLFVLADMGSMQDFLERAPVTEGPMESALKRAAQGALVVIALQEKALDEVGTLFGMETLAGPKGLMLVLEMDAGHARLTLEGDLADPTEAGTGAAFRLDAALDLDRLSTTLRPLIDRRLAREKAKARAMERLKRIAKAMREYAADNKKLPPIAVTAPNGMRLLSWRVALLPYLGPEARALHKKFRLDEPWNSPNNFPLLSQMPVVFDVPGPPGMQVVPNSSSVHVFVGPSTPFPFEGKGFPFPEGCTDGPANTILLVLGTIQAPWTEPGGIPAHLLPRPFLDKRFGNLFLVAMADGSVRELPLLISDQSLRAAISPAAGDKPGPDWKK